MKNYTKKDVRISLTRNIAEDYLTEEDNKISQSVDNFRKKLSNNFNLNEATAIKGYIPLLQEYIDEHPFLPVKDIQEVLLDEVYAVNTKKSPVVCTLMENKRKCIQKFNKKMNEDLYQLVNQHILYEALKKREKNQVIA